MTKMCFKCATEKPKSEFYAHPGMKDGLLNKCKECHRRDVLEHRAANLEKIRAYDRARGKTSARLERNAETTKKWRGADKRRTSAQNAVARAVRSGKLVKAPCVRCGNVNSLAHHDSYEKEKQLDVMWLCQPCHKERHKELVLLGITP